MVDENKFFAWLDGELAPDEAAEVERAVAADAELSRVADEHRAMTASLRGAFGTVTASPVPPEIAASVRDPKDNVVRMETWRRGLSRPFAGPVPQWAAMAATLVLGLLVGTTLNSGGSAPVETRGGAMYAAGAVDQALDAQLASAGEAGDVRIGLTFRDQSGSICRSFQTEASAGLACRQGSDWQVRGLFGGSEGAGADYRMAAGADPRLMELVDSTITGEPFDASQERTAKERGWR